MKVQAHGLGQLNVEVLYTLATVPCPEPSTTDWSVKRSGLARFRPESCLLSIGLPSIVRCCIGSHNPGTRGIESSFKELSEAELEPAGEPERGGVGRL